MIVTLRPVTIIVLTGWEPLKVSKGTGECFQQDFRIPQQSGFFFKGSIRVLLMVPLRKVKYLLHFSFL